MLLLARIVQEATASESIWSKLLGIDRLKLDGESNVELDWHNVDKGDVAWMVVFLILPAVALLSWLVYRRERSDVGTRPKLVLAGLRAALYFIVALMLMGPFLTVEIVKVRKSFVLVLVDDSLSMKKSDPPNLLEQKMSLARVANLLDPAGHLPANIDDQLRKLSRADLVKRVLENPELKILDKLEEQLNVAYFTFSKGARAAEDRAKFLQEYGPNDAGTETAIGESLTQALAMYKGQLVSAVVIISDGKNNFGVDPAKVARQLRARYVPVYTVIAGIPQKAKDIALLEPEGREAVLANDNYSFKLSVKSHGYEGEKSDILLYLHEIKDPTKEVGTDPKEIEEYLRSLSPEKTETIQLEGADRKQPVEFIITPRRPGDYLLIARAPAREDERTDLNNTLVHRLRVADDKIKVLFVDHPPRYEYRFLMSSLIRDTKILVHCLLTSADDGFPQEHTQHADDPLFKEPLKEWPHDLAGGASALKQLLNYDVIILGDVDISKLGDSKKVGEDLEKFVSNFGGGLIFQSGVSSNPRSYIGTPLERLLPVIPEEVRGSEMDAVYEKSYGFRLTDEAKVDGGHPIIKFPSTGNDLGRLIEQWEDNDQRGDGLVGIRWFARVAKVKPGARTLVQLTGVAGHDTGDSRPPLFVTQNYGYGRVFWSGTDETHLWRYANGPAPWFYPFWQNVMYWAREGKLLGARRFRLRVDRHDRRYMTGDPVLFYASAFDRDFNPLQDPLITLNIEPFEGERIQIELHKDKERDGYYEGSFQPKSVGPYRAWLGEEDESTRATEKFIVFIPNREEEEPILDEAQLRTIAREAHPEDKDVYFFSIDEIGRLPAAIKKSPQPLTEIKEDDLWDSPLVFLLFSLLITTEWVMRKVFRML